MDINDSDGRARGSKSRDAFRTISEVADELDLPQHVLRFWESKFNQIKPLKRGGNRRYYRPDDVLLLRVIKKLLHSDGYTIRGVQKLFKAQGLKATIDQVASGEIQVATEQHVTVTGASIAEVNTTGVSSALSRLKSMRARLS